MTSPYSSGIQVYSTLHALNGTGRRNDRLAPHDVQLNRLWFSHHNVQLDGLFSSGEMDFLHHLEPMLAVDDWVDVVAALEITGLSICIGLVLKSVNFTGLGSSLPFPLFTRCRIDGM